MKIVYIDMDGVIVDFQGAVSKLDIKDLEQYTDHKGVHYDRIPGIFATMEPIPGGIEAYRALLKHYEVYRATRTHQVIQTSETGLPIILENSMPASSFFLQ